MVTENIPAKKSKVFDFCPHCGREEKYEVQFHGLRHRNAGSKLLIEFHLLFREDVPIALAHERATRIEHEIHKALPIQAEIISHLEPIEGHDEIHAKLKGKEL